MPSAAAGITFEQVMSIVSVVVLPILVPLLLLLAKKLWGDLSAARLVLVKGAISVAYHATNEWARLTETKTDDKIAYALGLFNAALEAQGLKAKEADVELAKLAFKALHGVEKKVEEIAAIAPVVLASPRIPAR